MKIKITYQSLNKELLLPNVTDSVTLPYTFVLNNLRIKIEEVKDYEEEIEEKVISILNEHKESLIQAALKIMPVEEIELCSQKNISGTIHKMWIQRRQK